MSKMKKLDHLKWSPRWVSHMGCIKGCLDYLGIQMTDAWLYGGTGHAFVINIHDEVCPSGPTAWNAKMIFDGGRNLGYEFDGKFGWKENPEGFAKLQKEAWEFTRKSLDEGLPIYGWELDIPEFYVVYGYDEVGYYYSGPGADEGKGPKPWRELGDTGIGLIEMYSLKPGQAQPDEIIVKSAFQNVLKHTGNPKEWIHERYASGVKGFDTWISSLESEKADRFGMGYNSEVWGECRRFAVNFLKEAKERLGGKASGLFDEGIQHYQVVADRLTKVAQIYSFEHGTEGEIIKIDDKSQTAAALLKEARTSEAKGLQMLEKIVSEL
jgi:hypothetical protein